jgi:hypothetical protein
MKLFRSPLLECCWIACTSDNLWLRFPAKIDGWDERTPYNGDRRELVPVAPWSAFNTGFPHPDALLRSTRRSRAMAAMAA